MDNLGLRDTVKQAQNAFPRTGGSLSGNLNAAGYVKSGDGYDVVSGQDIRAVRHIYEQGERVYSPKNKPPQNIPVGSPIPWSRPVPPAGYVECRGQSFPTNQYPLLAEAYPSGVLPDLRGEFIRGLDAGRDVDLGREILTHQEGTIISGFDDNDNGDISGLGTPGIAFGDPLTDTQWRRIAGKKWRFSLQSVAQRYDWGAYVSARPRNIAFLYIVRAA
ncbi:phage tail protein [Xenorhabdus siamensis]|uniref:phage tail protein n=1 Tax=Xenorhabdus siamensis TaxID=3136254 RepID=UPI0030F42C45